MRYTVFRIDTLEMNVVNEVSPEQVIECRAGRVVIIDMTNGAELAAETFDAASTRSVASQAALSENESKAA